MALICGHCWPGSPDYDPDTPCPSKYQECAFAVCSRCTPPCTGNHNSNIEKWAKCRDCDCPFHVNPDGKRA